MSILSAAENVYPPSSIMPASSSSSESAAPSGPSGPADSSSELDLPSDPKVREVLLNGGFSWVKALLRGQIYEYERVSRDGQPLEGKEATSPPRYQVVAFGNLVLRCSCPAARGNTAACKHQLALAWSLGIFTLGQPASDPDAVKGAN